MKLTDFIPLAFIRKGRDNDTRRVNRVVIDLHRSTDALYRKDIADWRRAWQMAINVDNPDRRRLYDIYQDVDVDLHLSGCVEQRRLCVMSKSFKIVDRDGKEMEECSHYFDQPWFKQFVRLALEARYWGHSLIELGNVVTDADGCPSYDRVMLIPRKHVIPEYGRVVSTIGMGWRSGVDYRQPPYSHWLVEVGEPGDLGLYLKAATQTIPKKHMMAFWDSFGEIFGMPMRIARTATRDDNERERLNRMLQEAGASLTMVTGQETEIEFKESNRGDSFNVYDKRIDRCNSELSKLIIGQTMTIEDGSSLSQSQTHMEVFQNIIQSDMDLLRDTINAALIPRMVAHGFPLKGAVFEWDYSIDYTPEQQVSFEQLACQYFNVDPKYFNEKYGIPCTERKDNGLPMQPNMGKSGFFD